MARVFKQAGYRFGIDSGTEANHPWLEALNTPISYGCNKNFLLRILAQESGGTAIADVDFEFQYSLNGGEYTNITTSSTAVKAVAVDIFANGADCTSRLSGTGTFVSNNDGCTEDGTSGGTNNDVGASGNTETECGLQVVGTSVKNGDQITFRVTRDVGSAMDGYDVYPVLTVEGLDNPNVPDIPLLPEKYPSLGRR